MTKIISRPNETAVGEGDYLLRMSYEQLQYIGALVYNTRLGDGKYKEAAYEIVTSLEQLFDDDFIQDASADVNMRITIEDNYGNPVAEHHNDNICIEV